MDLLNIYGTVIFTAAVQTIKELVVKAVAERADLRGANLRGADLREANLYRADLYGADLREADLYRADLRGADLRGADLREADLYKADLRGADLREANLYRANLREANPYRADLRGADLREADLYRANLYGADLYRAKNISDIGAAQTVLLPEGNLVGWKKCSNNIIVKLLIPQKARRSNATGRKCRAEYVQVLRVYGAEVGVSTHNSQTIYRKGETVKCDQWNEDRWTECGGGIHFFITRAEAEAY